MELSLPAERHAVARLAGPQETAAANRLLKGVLVVPDNLGTRVAALQLSGGIGIADIQVFGTADQMGILIATSDARFLRAAAAQGVDIDAILHEPMSFVGQ